MNSRDTGSPAYFTWSVTHGMNARSECAPIECSQRTHLSVIRCRPTPPPRYTLTGFLRAEINKRRADRSPTSQTPRLAQRFRVHRTGRATLLHDKLMPRLMPRRVANLPSRAGRAQADHCESARNAAASTPSANNPALNTVRAISDREMPRSCANTSNASLAGRNTHNPK